MAEEKYPAKRVPYSNADNFRKFYPNLLHASFPMPSFTQFLNTLAIRALPLLIIALPIFSYAQYSTLGSASANGPDCFTLTPAANSQGGAVWSNTPIDPNQPFDIRGSIYLGNNNGGADGAAFVMQTIGTSAIGSTALGGSIGYGGLTPSLIVEFDTYQNSTFGDPAFDHVAILSAGSNLHTAGTSLAAPVGILPGNINAEDGQFHDVRFTWDTTSMVFRVYIDCQLTISYSGDIRTILNNSSTVYYGFTAATGGLNNLHQACFESSNTSPGNRTDLTICAGDQVTLTAPTGTNYSWTPATGLSGTSSQAVIATPAASTTYEVSYLDDCGFTIVDTFAIQVDPIGPINVDLGSDFALCPLEDSLLNPGLPGSYQYLWQDGSTNPTLTAIGPGTYHVRVQNSCNVGRDTVVVTPDNLPAPAFTAPDSICPGEITTLSISTAILPGTSYTWDLDGGTQLGGGGTTPLQVVWDTVGSKIVCLTVSRGGCETTVCENIIVKSPPEVFLNPVADQCFPGNSFTFTTVGDIADVYQWDFGASASPATFQGAIPPAVTYQSPGVKTVKLVTFGGGCQSADTAEISFEVIVPPSANFSVSSANICQNEQVLFTYQGQVLGATQTYFWNFGNGAVPQTSTQRNPGQVRYTNSGTKTVTLTVGYGSCSVSSTQTIEVKVTPSVSAGLDKSFCEGDGGVQLDANVDNGSGTYFYEWTCGLGTSCGFDSAFVEDPMVNPDGLNPPVDVTYYFQVTDANGCTSNRDSVVVTVNAKPKVDAGPDLSICEPDAPGINLQGSIAADNQAPQPITYTWTPSTGINGGLNTLTPYARPDTTTIYTLIGTSINGCSSEATTLDTTSSMTLRVRPIPTAFAGQDTGICIGESVRLDGSASGAGPDYTFTWTASPAGSLDDPSSANPIATPTQTTEYTLVVSSGGCISAGDNVIVKVDTKPTLTPGTGGAVCLFEPFQLNANASGDPRGDNYTYHWFPTTGLNNPDIYNPVATPLQTTTYQVWAESEFGCLSDTPSITISLKPTPEVELIGEDTTLCSNDTLSLEARHSFRTAAGAPLAYRWYPADAIVEEIADNEVRVSPNQSTYIIVETEVTTNNCATRDSIFVKVEPAITATVSADTTRFCAGESTTLYAVGGSGSARFSWIPAAGLADSSNATTLATPDTTTTYAILITEGVCSATDAITLEVNPVPEADYFSTIPAGCGTLEVSFMENAGEDAVGYIWNFGDGSPVSNEPDPTHYYSAPGNYVVTFTAIGPGGCEVVNTQTTVEVSDGPEVIISSTPDLSEPVPSHFDIKFMADGQGIEAYLWTFSDGGTASGQTVTYQFKEEGTFSVELTVTGEDGCVRTIPYGPFEIFPGDLQLQNVFTPNGDGLNDEFRLRYFGDGDYEVQVYDRWGRLVFTSMNPSDGWDGTLGETSAPTGVYFYHATIEGRRYEGNVTLLR